MKTFNLPLADKGLTSYRYQGQFGWVMIGARSNHEALSEAERSIEGIATLDNLEVWVGTHYEAV